jgi:hypothetical protein
VTRDERTHHAIVARLTGELTPVKPLRSPWTRLASWLVVALGTVALAAGVGLREDLALEIGNARYVGELAILLAGAGLAATLALLVAVPGRLGGRRARQLGLGLLVLALAAALLGDSVSATAERSTLWTSLRCVACVGLFGLVPWVALYAAVARAAPLDARTTALCVGAAAFLVGAAAVRTACPFDDVVHLIVWHGMSVALWTVASSALAAPRLGRWLTASALPPRDA